ncbi:MAG: hypothetical protein JSS45_09880 [Proteobacteria bacterium]|nr:hypothetical protein [Pseudomonadota bacterium]
MLVQKIAITMLAVIAVAGSHPANAAQTARDEVPNTSCQGAVHTEAIDLWESRLRHYFTAQIKEGLNRDGDVYVLYNTQEELQSFVEMTRRCRDTKQIEELVDLLALSFDSRRPLPGDSTALAWVCTGGNTCTSVNQLLGKEVPLCSAQFLGLLGALATTIVETIPAKQRTAAENAFVASTASALATHLDRWLSTPYAGSVLYRLRINPTVVVSGSSIYFFTDRDLWYMTGLSDLAELQRAGAPLDQAGKAAFTSLTGKAATIASMFDLFLARTSLFSGPHGQRAEIDRGYWSKYADFKYALYTGAASPVLCQKGATGAMQKTYRVQALDSYIDPGMGWDISHARRLVPALDTFIRNRQTLKAAFGYDNPDFDPVALQRAFANQIAAKIWNQDLPHPLFSNFWDGNNGWYRAGYENGTGGCRPGEAPYSLGWSFPTGGYLQWGDVNGTIRSLGMGIYKLIHATDSASMTFIAMRYPQMRMTIRAKDSAVTTQEIWSLSFLVDLVGFQSNG